MKDERYRGEVARIARVNSSFIAFNDRTMAIGIGTLTWNIHELHAMSSTVLSTDAFTVFRCTVEMSSKFVGECIIFCFFRHLTQFFALRTASSPSKCGGI